MADLIYTDKQGDDIGVITVYNLDNEVSIDADDCTFELDAPLDLDIYRNALYIYKEGTELGGVIDSHKHNTDKNIMYLSGRTWRGILGSKIIEPEAGQDYYTVSGELHTVLETLLEKISLTDLYSVKSTSTGVTITYQFARYTDAYTGIIKLLYKVGYKLSISWNYGKAELEAVPIADYTDEEGLTSDLFKFEITNVSNAPNHIIALGSGQLKDRLVLHKYKQEDGSIGDTQYYFGKDEIVIKLDYPNAESEEDLEEKAIDELKKAADKNTIKITSSNLEADLCDKFSALDIYTGFSIVQNVVSKIIKLTPSEEKISYKVGVFK